MEQLEEYLLAFDISLDEFLLIGFDDSNRIALITKKDLFRIKYEFKDDIESWNIARKCMPKELEFVGFQKSLEGNSFISFRVKGVI